MAAFEYSAAVQEIRRIVQLLESNETELSESIELYKKARTLIDACQSYLQNASLEIQTLTPDNSLTSL